MFIGLLLNSLGSGLTLPLLVVYLHEVRGISVLSASIVIAWMSIFGLVATGPVGMFIDRVGPKPVLLTGLIFQTIATAGWIAVHNVQTAYLIGMISAMGQSATWAPQATMLSRAVMPDERQRIFGIQFMVLNLGLGLGGIISAIIVDTNHPISFTYLYLLDACSYLSYFVIVLLLPNLLAKDALGFQPEEEQGNTQEGSYRDLIANRTLVFFFFASLILLTCGYGSIDAGLAPLLTIYSDQSVKVLGPIWAVNTGVIVLGQLYFIKRIEGRSRSRLLQVVALLWALSWAMMLGGIHTPAYGPAIVAALSTAVFACGEMIWSPVGPAIVNDLAPEHLRGRYNAVNSLVWVVSGSIGPAFSGIMLNHSLAKQWIITLLIGCLIAAVLLGQMRHKLTASQDGREPISV